MAAGRAPVTEAAPQREVIDFLETPEAHGAPATATVTRIETHISVIFLVGDDAYKLKRAVRFDYLDFSTLEARRRACEAEIAINRRTAPMLYLGVVAVTRAADGALALGGDGPAVEWLVHMRRFDQDGLFDRLARRGALDPAIMTALAETIAAFHRAAEIRRDKGGRAGMAWVIAGNAADFAAHPNDPFDPEAVERLVAGADAALDRLGALLDARRAAGRVRHCHGDLSSATSV